MGRQVKGEEGNREKECEKKGIGLRDRIRLENMYVANERSENRIQRRDSPLLNSPNYVEWFPNDTIPYLDVISDLAALAAFSLTEFSFSL